MFADQTERSEADQAFANIQSANAGFAVCERSLRDSRTLGLRSRIFSLRMRTLCSQTERSRSRTFSLRSANAVFANTCSRTLGLRILCSQTERILCSQTERSRTLVRERLVCEYCVRRLNVREPSVCVRVRRSQSANANVRSANANTWFANAFANGFADQLNVRGPSERSLRTQPLRVRRLKVRELYVRSLRTRKLCSQIRLNVHGP